MLQAEAGPATGATRFLLDVTRTLRRAELGETGVDRVEHAYARQIIRLDPDALMICRVAGGGALLDRRSLDRTFRRIADGDWAQPDLTARLSLRQGPDRQRIDATIRDEALGWALSATLPALLRRHLAPGFTVLNVGHTHLSTAVMRRMRGGGAGCIAVLVHDMIPLDHPEYVRKGSEAGFRQRMLAVAQGADVVIANSEDTRAAYLRHMPDRRPGQTVIAAPLGIDPVPAIPRMTPARAEFAIVGTIEPRKNHALLLDVWERMAATTPIRDLPVLHIIGRRGWAEPSLLARLDAHPLRGTAVIEHGYLSEQDRQAILSRLRALLFPSFAEGFGFPLFEALAQGVPVIASDLPAFREIAPDAATYLPPDDAPAWETAIRTAANANPALAAPPPGIVLPGWDDHFRTVFEALAR